MDSNEPTFQQRVGQATRDAVASHIGHETLLRIEGQQALVAIHQDMGQLQQAHSAALEELAKTNDENGDLRREIEAKRREIEELRAGARVVIEGVEGGDPYVRRNLDASAGAVDERVVFDTPVAPDDLATGD